MEILSVRRRYPAAFIRGGTSKAIVFHARDLPEDRREWDAIFLSAMGSPDEYGRQLNGMGGGVSSLSKVCVVGPPSVEGADVDYTFVQVQVKHASCDYGGNCGNMSSAIGPFAVDERLVAVADSDEATVRIHNTNTHKIIHARFAVRGGRSVERGELSIPGVSGTGAPIRLDFLDPGGATTGRLLPTGHVVDTFDVPGIGPVEASMVDAANSCVFLNAASLGLSGIELPDALEGNPDVMRKLGEIRVYASVVMGLAGDVERARANRLLPFIAFVSAPQDSPSLNGDIIPADGGDLVVRVISNGLPHRALPLTGALCTAVAAQIEGTIPNRLLRKDRTGALRLSMPSGVLTVSASVGHQDGAWRAERGSFYRTCRRLFDGHVYA